MLILFVFMFSVFSSAAFPSIDSTSSADTSRYYTPIFYHGSYIIRQDSSRIISKKNIRPSTQFGITDVLHNTFSSIPLSLGGLSLNNSVSIYGSSRQDIALRYNTRSLTNTIHGGINLSLFPVETAESIEVLTGTHAIVLGDNASGLLLNIKEGIHNISTPFTRLRYAQSSYNFVASEGEFSQNIAKNWNIDAGFRRHVGEGRFANTWIDMWNVYGKIRWTLPRTQWSFSHIFTNYGTGINGGLSDTTNTFSDPINAKIRYSDMFERTYSHDLTLSFSRHSSDTTLIQTASLYFSYGIRNIEKTITLNPSAADSNRISSPISRNVGALYQFHKYFTNILSLKIGAEAEAQLIDKSAYNSSFSGTNLAVFSLMDVSASSNIQLQPGARLRLFNNTVFANMGIKIEYSQLPFRFGFDISLSSRTPTLTEGLNNNSEQHLLGIAYLQWKGDRKSLGVELFSRSISDYILQEPLLRGQTIVGVLSQNMGNRTVMGLSVNGHYDIVQNGHLHGSVILHDSKTNSINDNRLPFLQSILGGEYIRVFGRSTVKAGISFRFFSSNYGELFIPQMQGSIANQKVNEGLTYDGGQAFIGAQLGNAFVQFSLHNMLNSVYWTTSLYPELDRHLRISVNWAFLD
ncbi:MAG TPA: TonB-dependent receptor plug domain-containing protein [Candidatus Kapabacteria bacterium]|nr:TonB-dependent receptor plug domain-containing protein [Candidatus Kapabacteria bacterium]HRK59324.1 TonB-dependent receptor plug domain-containing protein [Candidatus Kapabacteria bacterium]